MRNEGIIDIQKQLLPDLIDALKKRYTVLNPFMCLGLLGRRTLAASLDMTERVLRAETDFLKEQGLLDIDSQRDAISRQAKILLSQMEPMVKESVRS